MREYPALLIVGTSIFAHALESALSEWSGAQAALIDPVQDGPLPLHILEQPACIFFERETLEARQIWTLIRQKHILIEIDPSTTTCRTIHSRRHTLANRDDLRRLLQQLAEEHAA